MFQPDRIFKSMIVILLSMAVAFSTMAFTVSDSYKELPEKRNISTDMVISIPFGRQLSPSSINTRNIYVKDVNGKLVPLSRSLSKDNKTILIRPLRGYAAGQTYTLYIKGTVKFSTGTYTGQYLKMKLTAAKQLGQLPNVGSGDKLAELMKKMNEAYGGYYTRRGGAETFVFNEMMAPQAAGAGAADAAAPSGANSSAKSADYSRTNVQVQGVDEADVVKTDGQFIYQINNGRVIIARAYPETEMKIADVIKYDGQFWPNELYVDEHYMVVIGNSNNSINAYKTAGPTAGVAMYPGYYMNNTTKLYVYDISDKTKITQIREVELEGSYLTSRKIGSKVYLVANKHFNYYSIYNKEESSGVPSYKDSAAGKEFKSIDYKCIYYFPEAVEPNYMVVAGLNLDNRQQGVNVSAYLGSGENVFATDQNMYVAVSKYDWTPQVYDSAAQQKQAILPQIHEEKTVAYRFVLNEGKVEYSGKGEVPGTILNQFSMDESNGSFRIATTKGQIWVSGDGTSKNNLYLLDDDMKIKGRLEDIAPGEKIYSVRFMGNRAYIVTFRKVDPLFVIDLKDEKAPKILGALKIPGYSDYLHPYDENHIIGFGKDSIEIPYKDQNGVVIGTNAYYMGMKLAIFDVTDVAHPKELFKEKIGDRGTDSELLRNHKALLFSKEKGLLAFPVTLMELPEGTKPVNEQYNSPEYGTFTFQGAYVYNIDLKTGFKLKGRISHITDEEYKKMGNSWYYGENYIDRILYIGDNLYTLSKGTIKASAINDLRERGKIIIP